MKTIAVTSGKGGVGKTSLTANLGIALAQRGYRVTLFDADLELANLDVALGIRPEFTLQHVVAEAESLADVRCPGPGGVLAIAGGSAIGTLMHAGPKRLGIIVEQLPMLERDTDVLLFDTSAGIDRKVMAFLRLADEVLLVTTPDPSSVTDAYGTLKVLFRRKPDAQVRMVANMCSSAAEGEAVFDTLRRVVNRFLKKDITFGGAVRQDPRAAEASRRRKPFVVGAPTSLAALDVQEVAKRIGVGRSGILPDAPMHLDPIPDEDSNEAFG